MPAKTPARSNWLLTASRIMWWALFLLFVGVYLADIVSLVGDPQGAFQTLMRTEPGPAAISASIGLLGWSQPVFLLLYLLPEFIAAVAFLGVGLLISRRRPSDWFSWFISIWMVAFGLTATSIFGLSIPETSPFIAFYYLSVLLAYMGIVYFLLAFPDGKFHPTWTRYVAIAWTLFIVSTVVSPWFNWDSYQSALVIVPLLGVVLYSQVHRYRNVSTPSQKEQTKWLIFAIAANVVLVALAAVLEGQAVGVVDTGGAAIFTLLSNAAEFIANFLLVLAVGFAILRYRLWDIEVVVNRALIYGPLSVVLAAIFAVSVALINQTTRQLLGAEAAVPAAAISALVVATFFQPVRTRIEGWINKKVYPDNANLARELVEISDPRFALSAPALIKLVTDRIPAVLNSDAGAVYQPSGPRGFKQAATWGLALPASFSLDSKARADLAAGKVTAAGPGQLLVPLYVPRLRSKELVGALALGLRKNGRGYSSDERHALAELGAQVGTALHAAQLRAKR